MSGRAAAALHPHLAGHQVELVVERGDRLRPAACRTPPPPARTRRRRSCRSAASAPGPSRRRWCPRRPAPLKRCRHGENPWRIAIVSSAMKPILWRLRAIPGSGLPRPTQSSMAPVPGRVAGAHFLPWPALHALGAGRRCRGGASAPVAAAGFAAAPPRQAQPPPPRRRPRPPLRPSWSAAARRSRPRNRAVDHRARSSVPFRSCQRTLSLKSSRSEVGGELLRDLVRVADTPRPRGARRSARRRASGRG